jgi:hypothetical protein
MLADKVDHIIGVDTHKDSHTIALVSPAGAAIAHRTVPANPIGYLCGYRFAVEQAPGRRTSGPRTTPTTLPPGCAASACSCRSAMGSPARSTSQEPTSRPRRSSRPCIPRTPPS